MPFLSDVIPTPAFELGKFNVITAPVRCGKTFWAMNNLDKYARGRKYVLYITDTSVGRQAALSFEDKTIEIDEAWVRERLGRPQIGGPTEDCIRVATYQKLAAMCRRSTDALEFLDDVDVVCWDECDSIFDFAISEIDEIKKEFKRVPIAEALSMVQKASCQKKYSAIIFLGEIRKVIEKKKTIVVGVSATPERASSYYQSLTSVTYDGGIELKQRARGTSFFTDIMKLIDILPKDGYYYCYGPSVRENQAICKYANSLGFVAEELHSQNNPIGETEAQAKIRKSILDGLGVPDPYNFLIINKAMGRGYSLSDPRFNTCIQNTTIYADQQQSVRSPFPVYIYQKTMAPQIPEEYLNKEIPVCQWREIVKAAKLKNDKGELFTWNSLRKILENYGYTVKQRRKAIGDGKHEIYYTISGTFTPPVPALLTEKDIALCEAEKERSKDYE